MADKVDYQNAALAALTAAESGQPVPEPETPPADESAGEIVETTEEPDGKLEAPKPDEAEEKEEKPAEPPPPDKKAKTWEEIAREKAKVRAEKEALARDADRVRRAEALLQAAESGDAMGLLAAAKIPWSKAAKQVIDGGKSDPTEPEKKAPESDLAAQVAELKAELQAAKVEKAKGNLLTKIKEKASASDQFKFVAGLEAESQAMDYMVRYFNETGENLGETLEESIEIALSAVEQNLSKTGERWKKVLIPAGSENKGNGKPASPSVTSSKPVAKTLTHDTGSGPKGSTPVKPKGPKSTEDYQSEALASYLAASPE